MPFNTVAYELVPANADRSHDERIEEARKANRNSLLLLVAKGGKAAEMRFIALKLKE